MKSCHCQTWQHRVIERGFHPYLWHQTRILIWSRTLFISFPSHLILCLLCLVYMLDRDISLRSLRHPNTNKGNHIIILLFSVLGLFRSSDLFFFHTSLPGASTRVPSNPCICCWGVEATTLPLLARHLLPALWGSQRWLVRESTHQTLPWSSLCPSHVALRPMNWENHWTAVMSWWGRYSDELNNRFSH